MSKEEMWKILKGYGIESYEQLVEETEKLRLSFDIGYFVSPCQDQEASTSHE